jgi:hypothetical protein
MALSQSGGGYQVGDGNPNDVALSTQIVPVPTATVTATLTVPQITGGMLVGSPGASAASYTLPTVAQLEAALVNANRVGQSFALSLINLGTSSGVITVLVGTGWTIVGAATVAIATSSLWEAVKTGDGTWSLYRQA